MVFMEKIIKEINSTIADIAIIHDQEKDEMIKSYLNGIDEGLNQAIEIIEGTNRNRYHLFVYNFYERLFFKNGKNKSI